MNQIAHLQNPGVINLIHAAGRIFSSPSPASLSIFLSSFAHLISLVLHLPSPSSTLHLYFSSWPPPTPPPPPQLKDGDLISLLSFSFRLQQTVGPGCPLPWVGNLASPRPGTQIYGKALHGQISSHFRPCKAIFSHPSLVSKWVINP